MERFDFDMDYSSHVIVHFQGFEAEASRLAAKFLRTIERSCSDYVRMADHAFALAISNAPDEFLGTPKLLDIY